MLSRLRVRDLAIVEDVTLEFDPGLNVLTGETGTGKSLLVEAVSLLVGGRGDAGVVREGAAATVVEGEFELARSPARDRVAAVMERWGWEWDGGTLILRRELSAEGKSRCSVNHSPATVTGLRALGEALADIHGQQDHQSLLQPGAALELLDRAAGLAAQRAAYAEALAAWRAAEDRLQALRADLRQAAEQADYLAHALQEIDAARLRAGEEEELRAEAERRRHAERLRAWAAGAAAELEGLEGGAAPRLAAAERALQQAAAVDPALEEPAAAVTEARIGAQEAARALERYLESLDADPEALQQLEERRALLASLRRKYRRDVPELLAWAEETRARLARHQSGEGLLGESEAEARTRLEDCLERAGVLSAGRRQAARSWAARVRRELKPLGLPRARLEAGLEWAEDAQGVPWRGLRVRLGPTGLDRAELRFSANPGEPAQPLARVASGGELARVMLALKSVLGEDDRVDLLLFDEVDSGIGGAVAQAVGERLRRLGQHRQVLCVTHLPILAAMATRQFHVDKETRSGRTRASAHRLGTEERVEEIARMMAGERASTTTRRQARELMDLAPAARG